MIRCSRCLDTGLVVLRGGTIMCPDCSPLSFVTKSIEWLDGPVHVGGEWSPAQHARRES